MMEFKSTREVARILGVGVSRLSQAVWRGDIPEPERGPGNSFCWTEEDINRASKALLGKLYRPEQVTVAV